MTESRTLDKGWGMRTTNIYENCYLHIKWFPTNSLTVLMWKWYLNSEQEFREVWDGTIRNSKNQIYTCMVKMILKSWYIAWEGRQRGGFEKTPEKKDQRTSYWKKNSWLLIKLLRPSYSGYTEDSLCILCS